MFEFVDDAPGVGSFNILDINQIVYVIFRFQGNLRFRELRFFGGFIVHIGIQQPHAEFGITDFYDIIIFKYAIGIKRKNDL